MIKTLNHGEMNDFEKKILILHGEKGKQWLDTLPHLIAQAATTYDLSNLTPLKNLNHHYVLSGFKKDQPIILKLGLDYDGFKREAAALRAFSKWGAIQIFSENNGVLLQKRAIPGISLKAYFPEKENEAISAATHIIKRLHTAPIPPTHTFFPHIKEWLAALDKEWNIPMSYLQKARQLRDYLLKTSGKDILLHGDLHHDNILKNGDHWIVIDPKGVIGESAYEATVFIRNPIPDLCAHKDLLPIILRRIGCFAKIHDVSEHRILKWCFVQSILAWIWALEDGCDTEYWLNITTVFYMILDKNIISLKS